VKQQCLNLLVAERNSRDVVKCGDKFNMNVRREVPIKVSLPSNSERCMVYEEGQATKNFCKEIATLPNQNILFLNLQVVFTILQWKVEDDVPVCMKQHLDQLEMKAVRSI
jgi:hypothetical protein